MQALIATGHPEALVALRKAERPARGQVRRWCRLTRSRSTAARCSCWTTGARANWASMLLSDTYEEGVQRILRAEPVLTARPPAGHLPAETARRSTITQIYEGTNQIQRMVMARQLLK